MFEKIPAESELDENNELMDSGSGPLFGSDIGILPPGSFKAKKFGIKKKKNS